MEGWVLSPAPRVDTLEEITITSKTFDEDTMAAMVMNLMNTVDKEMLKTSLVTSLSYFDGYVPILHVTQIDLVLNNTAMELVWKNPISDMRTFYKIQKSSNDPLNINIDTNTSETVTNSICKSIDSTGATITLVEIVNTTRTFW